jgi:lipid-A-disaccharide synthase
VLTSLPRLLRRIRQTADEIVRAKPDVLVLIDVPSFNLRVARIVRRRDPAIAIVDYVSPTVWAYNSRRSRWMVPFVDHILAIFPFEPRVHRELGGPPCTYVGHPLLEQIEALRPEAGERELLAEAERPVLLVLPGSRRSEISRLMEPFGETVAMLLARFGDVEVVLPAVAHLAGDIRVRAAAWPVRPRIVEGEAAKLMAFRRAHAALAASGSVTLELALAGVPMVVAYRLDAIGRMVKPILQARSMVSRFLKVRSIVLANLVLDSATIPEFIDGEATPERLCAALIPLLQPSAARARQTADFERLDDLLAMDQGTPSALAADAVIAAVREKRLHKALARGN